MASPEFNTSVTVSALEDEEPCSDSVDDALARLREGGTIEIDEALADAADDESEVEELCDERGR
jgi:hypothetical protein